ncbi:uncharacterized protein LOC108111902 [Drosophila eugracilis]|uniref:uncharacterized protein LOC108111902 n=1 Tax=Drosophila eugracilis TaxID=29029 RepID=UPI0007E8007B|nr:uncharacterized protein LOC108111902 [Drosophila eugracilis]
MVRRRLLTNSANQASINAYQQFWQQQHFSRAPLVAAMPEYWHSVCNKMGGAMPRMAIIAPPEVSSRKLSRLRRQLMKAPRDTVPIQSFIPNYGLQQQLPQVQFQRNYHQNAGNGSYPGQSASNAALLKPGCILAACQSQCFRNVSGGGGAGIPPTTTQQQNLHLNQGNIFHCPAVSPMQWQQQQYQVQQQHKQFLLEQQQNALPVGILKNSSRIGMSPHFGGDLQTSNSLKTKRVTIKSTTAPKAKYQQPTVEQIKIKPDVPPKPNKKIKQNLLRKERQQLQQLQLQHELMKQHQTMQNEKEKMQDQKNLQELQHQNELKKQRKYQKVHQELDQCKSFNFGKLANRLIEGCGWSSDSETPMFAAANAKINSSSQQNMPPILRPAQKLRSRSFSYVETKDLQTKPDNLEHNRLGKTSSRRFFDRHVRKCELGNESSTMTLTTEQQKSRTQFNSCTSLTDKATNTKSDPIDDFLRKGPQKAVSATSATSKGSRKLNLNELLRNEKVKGLEGNPMWHSLMQLVAHMCETRESEKCDKDQKSRLRAGSGSDGLQKQYSVYLMVTSDEEDEDKSSAKPTDEQSSIDTNVANNEGIRGQDDYANRCFNVYQAEHTRSLRRRRSQKKLNPRLRELSIPYPSTQPQLPMRRPLHWPKPDFSKPLVRSNRTRNSSRVRIRSSTKQAVKFRSQKFLGSALDEKRSWRLWQDLPMTAKVLNKAYSRMLRSEVSRTQEIGQFLSMAAQFSNKYLTIENATSGRSTSTDNNDNHGSVSFTGFGSSFVGLTFIPERRKRVCGGDAEYYQQNNLLRNPLVVRSGDYPDDDGCLPSCPYYQGMNHYQPSPNPYQKQDNQLSGAAQHQQAYYDSCYAPQARSQSAPRDLNENNCGCNSPTARRAYRTASSHYMEYKEFQHSPKRNPIPDKQRYNKYPQESQRSSRLQKKSSDCSCRSAESQQERNCVQRTERKMCYGSGSSESQQERNRVQRTERKMCYGSSPERTNRSSKKKPECSCDPGSSPVKYRTERTNREQKRSSECECDSGSPPEKRRAQRTNRSQKNSSECSCESESLAEKQQVQRSNRFQKKTSECCCGGASQPGRQQSVQRRSASEKRKTPQVDPTCSVRCHARSHVKGPPPPTAPKRKCPCSSPPPTSRKPTPKSQSPSSSKRSKRRCSVCNRCSDEDSEPNDYMERSRSRTEALRNPLVQSRSSYDCNDNLSNYSYSDEYPVQRRMRSSSPRKTKAECRSCSRKEPPICSNETLVEKPVKSYRFNCAENGKCSSCRKLCPKCHKVQPQKPKSSSTKRCAASIAQKCCPMCGLLPMMPNISIPNVNSGNRIIYKTLGRCRPRKLPKSKYELTICCKKRCQGGRNSHYMTSTIATSLKRRAKTAMTGGNPVAPSRMSGHRQGLRQSLSPAQNVTSHLQPAGYIKSQSRAGQAHFEPATSDQQRERPAAPPQYKMRSPSASLVQKSERRVRENEPTPSPPPKQRSRSITPGVEVRSSSRHQESNRVTSYPKDQLQSQRSQPDPPPSYRSQPELASSKRSRPEPEIPAANTAPVSLEPQVSEPIRRGASYLGTEVNPFYRGSFLKVRCSRDSHPNRLSPIHQRGEKIMEMPKLTKAPALGIPLKYTRLSQLHAWVFGDPFVKGNDNLGTWSWRQVFGRRKKSSAAPKGKSVKTIEAKQKRTRAGNESQTDISQDSQDKVCPNARPATPRSCPGSQSSPENMYVLKNCDRCQDYTVTPCNNGCRCPKRGTQCDGQCDIPHQEKSQLPSQETLSEAVTPRLKTASPSKSSFGSNTYRRMGGNCPICQLCGHGEIQQPGQSMCAQCNEKIQAAVDTYYVQCQGQCQQTPGQPCPYQQDHLQGQQVQQAQPQPQPQPPGQWQQLTGNQQQQHQPQPGDQPFNIIVLQDCNNHSLIDQLTTAISRGGGQIHTPTGAQRSESNFYPNYPNYPSHRNSYQGNPLTGYIDYEYLDPRRPGYDGYEPERDDRYDYAYNMSPWPMDPYYPRDGYEEERYDNGNSCNSYDCPAKNELDSLGSNQYNATNQSPGIDQAESCPDTCTCNCQFCRKAFDTREKLAMLIAQALEIFINNNNSKQKNQEVPRKHSVLDPRTKELKVKRKSRSSELSGKRYSKPKNDSNLGTAKSSRSKFSSPSTPISKTTSYHSNKSATKLMRNGLHTSSKDTSVQSITDQDSIISRSKDLTKPPFFLPNCQEHRCKKDCKGACSRYPHDCSKGCKSICRGPCSKSGGGDGRHRSKASKSSQRLVSRCYQCNQGEGRQWREVPECPNGEKSGGANGAPGCAGCGKGNDRSLGGDGREALLGLSPIAHYRPGMMKFPVNYLLPRTNYRRSLVRTAAGVTLHQKPYLDKSDAKDLPNFPCRKKSSSPDCRTPVKKWL